MSDYTFRGHVYFAQVDRFIKIGYSANPFSRVRTITRLGKRPDEIAYDAPADLIGYIPGDRRREADIRCDFPESQVAGEWHELTAEDVRPLIWADPRGVDVQRMSGLAVLTMLEHPDLTREDVAALGVPIDATPWPPKNPIRDTGAPGGATEVSHAALLSGVDRGDAGTTPAGVSSVSGVAS